MLWLANRIGNPETAHDVATPEEYRLKARRALGVHGLAIHMRGGTQPDAFVSAGRWVCMCECGNAPSAHPNWGFAVCFECGLETRPIFPANWRTYESVLLAREHAGVRHWFSTEESERRGMKKTQSVLDLARENRAEGRPATRRMPA